MEASSVHILIILWRRYRQRKYIEIDLAIDLSAYQNKSGPKTRRLNFSKFQQVLSDGVGILWSSVRPRIRAILKLYSGGISLRHSSGLVGPYQGGGADPAASTRGGADPATSTNSSRRQGQTAQDAQEHALYSVPHVPWHQGNSEVPGCGPTCGIQGTSVPLSASAAPPISRVPALGALHFEQ